MLSIVLGSDRALAKRALGGLLSTVDPTGFDPDRIEASTTSYDAIFAAVTAAPFFGSQRVVVLTGMLSQASGKNARGSKSKTDGDLGRLLASIPETTSLVLFDPELSELNASVRKQLPAGVQISVNEAPRGSALVDLSLRIAAEHGSTLDKSVARVLLDRLFPAYWPQAPKNRAFDRPPSVEQLESEIAKLSLAAYPGSITSDIVVDLVPLRSKERIFPLLDAVIGGDRRNALVEIQNAHASGEDPSRTMAQIYQQIELAVGAIASGRPQDATQAARALGIGSAYRLTRVTETTQRGRVPAAQQLRLALENDRKLKSGRLRGPDEALVDLVVRATRSQENR